MRQKRIGLLTVPVVLLCGSLPASASSEPAQRSYAIFVGWNGPPADSGMSPLRHADDEVFRWARLLAPMLDDLVVLTESDAGTRQRFHPLLPHARPTRESLRAAFHRFNQPGARILYVHVSHGARDIAHRGGEGYVMLGSGPYYRSDLRDDLVDRLHPSARLDIVVDACNAFYFLLPESARPRGEDRFGDLLDRQLARDDIRGRPRVGLISATAGPFQVWESDDIGGSFFSHLVRSALLGAADGHGEGVVRYVELRAFLDVHWRRTDPNQPLAIAPFVHAPASDMGAVLADWRHVPEGRVTRLLFDERTVGEVRVVDEANDLVASFRKRRDHRLTLRLPATRRHFIQLEQDGTVRVLQPRPGATISVANLEVAELGRARGESPEVIAYRRALDCSLFEGYSLAHDVPYSPCGGLSDLDVPHAFPSRRLRAVYRLGDAPTDLPALAHGVGLSFAWRFGSHAELGMEGWLEGVPESSASDGRPVSLLDVGMGLVVSAPMVRLASWLGLAPSVAGGFAFVRYVADGAAEWSNADGYVRSEIGFDVGTGAGQGHVAVGLEVGLRRASGDILSDLRWLAHLGGSWVF